MTAPAQIPESDLRRRIADGERLIEIGRRYGVHYSTVGRICEKYGIKYPQSHGPRPLLPNAEALARLIEDGALVGDIAARHGTGTSAIYRMLSRHGYALRGGRVERMGDDNE